MEAYTWLSILFLKWDPYMGPTQGHFRESRRLPECPTEGHLTIIIDYRRLNCRDSLGAVHHKSCSNLNQIQHGAKTNEQNLMLIILESCRTTQYINPQNQELSTG